MTLDEKIKESMLDYLKRQGEPAVKVVRWVEDVEASGYCETCYYEQDVVVITYVTDDDVEIAYTVRDSFGYLIQELTVDE